MGSKYRHSSASRSTRRRIRVASVFPSECAGDRQMLRAQRRSRFAQIVKSVFAYPLLTVVYTLSGKLGLMLAVPPGYASPIFPAAGIAVTAALIRGRATLPWIFLGSLLLNLWAGYLIDPEFGETCVTAAIIIAAASTLQAAIGGAILRRAIGYPAPLDNGRDISRFLLLSPVSCLTSATLSLAGLSVLGAVARPDLATSWISWWIGDTLGVLVVLPLMLVVAGEPRTFVAQPRAASSSAHAIVLRAFYGNFCARQQMGARRRLAGFPAPLSPGGRLGPHRRRRRCFPGTIGTIIHWAGTSITVGLSSSCARLVTARPDDSGGQVDAADRSRSPRRLRGGAAD
jgi:MASE1